MWDSSWDIAGGESYTILGNPFSYLLMVTLDLEMNGTTYSLSLFLKHIGCEHINTEGCTSILLYIYKICSLFNTIGGLSIIMV